MVPPVQSGPVALEEAEVAGVPCLVARPATSRGRLLYLHGGGYRMGSARLYAAAATRFAADASVTVVSVD